MELGRALCEEVPALRGCSHSAEMRTCYLASVRHPDQMSEGHKGICSRS
jgi:hypothetical protein